VESHRVLPQVSQVNNQVASQQENRVAYPVVNPLFVPLESLRANRLQNHLDNLLDNHRLHHQVNPLVYLQRTLLGCQLASPADSLLLSHLRSQLVALAVIQPARLQGSHLINRQVNLRVNHQVSHRVSRLNSPLVYHLKCQVAYQVVSRRVYRLHNLVVNLLRDLRAGRTVLLLQFLRVCLLPHRPVVLLLFRPISLVLFQPLSLLLGLVVNRRGYLQEFRLFNLRPGLLVCRLYFRHQCHQGYPVVFPLDVRVLNPLKCQLVTRLVVLRVFRRLCQLPCHQLAQRESPPACHQVNLLGCLLRNQHQFRLNSLLGNRHVFLPLYQLCSLRQSPRVYRLVHRPVHRLLLQPDSPLGNRLSSLLTSRLDSLVPFLPHSHQDIPLNSLLESPRHSLLPNHQENPLVSPLVNLVANLLGSHLASLQVNRLVSLQVNRQDSLLSSLLVSLQSSPLASLLVNHLGSPLVNQRGNLLVNRRSSLLVNRRSSLLVNRRASPLSSLVSSLQSSLLVNQRNSLLVNRRDSRQGSLVASHLANQRSNHLVSPQGIRLLSLLSSLPLSRQEYLLVVLLLNHLGCHQECPPENLQLYQLGILLVSHRASLLPNQVVCPQHCQAANRHPCRAASLRVFRQGFRLGNHLLSRLVSLVVNRLNSQAGCLLHSRPLFPLVSLPVPPQLFPADSPAGHLPGNLVPSRLDNLLDNRRLFRAGFRRVLRQVSPRPYFPSSGCINAMTTAVTRNPPLCRFGESRNSVHFILHHAVQSRVFLRTHVRQNA
jgi:hypothetical protein